MEESKREESKAALLEAYCEVIEEFREFSMARERSWMIDLTRFMCHRMKRPLPTAVKESKKWQRSYVTRKRISNEAREKYRIAARNRKRST